MEEGDHGLDAGGEEVVDEFLVEGDSGGVDGVVAPSQWDEARPGEGEAVGAGAGFLEELNVVRQVVVGVACYVAAVAAGDFAGDLAEGVPDGWASAVGGWCAFDLVAVVNA